MKRKKKGHYARTGIDLRVFVVQEIKIETNKRRRGDDESVSYMRMGKIHQSVYRIPEHITSYHAISVLRSRLFQLEKRHVTTL